MVLFIRGACLKVLKETRRPNFHNLLACHRGSGWRIPLSGNMMRKGVVSVSPVIHGRLTLLTRRVAVCQ